MPRKKREDINLPDHYITEDMLENKMMDVKYGAEKDVEAIKEDISSLKRSVQKIAKSINVSV